MKKWVPFAIVGVAVAGLLCLALVLLPKDMGSVQLQTQSVSATSLPTVVATLPAQPVATPSPTARPTPSPTPEATPAPPTGAPAGYYAYAPPPLGDLPIATSPDVDTTQVNNAVVTVRMHSDKKLKVQIKRQGNTMTHDLRADNTPTRLPLNLGTGEYALTVLENAGGTRYRQLSSDSFSALWDDANLPYLQSTQRMYWEPDFAAIRAAFLLAAAGDDDIEAIYQELAGTLAYNWEVLNKLPTGYIPSVEDTYATRLGICYDFSALLAAMLRSEGIPAKLSIGVSRLIDGPHAWNEVWVDDRWVVVDLTIDSIYRESGDSYSFEKDASDYSTDRAY